MNPTVGERLGAYFRTQRMQYKIRGLAGDLLAQRGEIGDTGIRTFTLKGGTHDIFIYGKYRGHKQILDELTVRMTDKTVDTSNLFILQRSFWRRPKTYDNAANTVDINEDQLREVFNVLHTRHLRS